MALFPTSPSGSDNPLDQRRAAEQDALLREVDEAYRQDQFGSFMASYGKPLGAFVLAGLLAFGGWLWWSDHSEKAHEATSESLVKAIDQLDARNLTEAMTQLEPLAAGQDQGAAVVAKLTRAGILLGQDKAAEAVKIYAAVAADPNAPKPYRDLATIREIQANYEHMKPADVEARLKPLAKPGSPFFGSAGELLGAAYLDQGKRDLAGPLFAAIAKDKDVPDSLRSRARQLSGLLGVDAVVDVDAAMKETATEAPATAAAE